MNFAWLPFSKNPHGFWIAVGAQAAISVALFVALRWRQLI
jgi:Mg2+ and Co2+ transporter CorA